MSTISSIFQYMGKLFDPRPFLKYTIESYRSKKWLFLVAFLLFVVSSAFCIDLSWADPLKDLDFIGSVEQITVDLTDTYGGYAKSVYDLIKPIGQSLAIMYWLIKLSEVMMRSDLSPEHLGLEFLKITVFVIALEEGWTILTHLFDFFNDAFDTISTELGTLTPADATTVTVTFDGLSDVPWWECIPLVMELGTFMVFKMFCRLVTSLLVWTRKLKLLVFASMAPVGVADFIGGTRSGSMRFLKKMIALGLQGVIMYVIVYCGNLLMIEALGSTGVTGDYVENIKNGSLIVFTFLIGSVPPALAMLAAFNKSEELSNNILGVH